MARKKNRRRRSASGSSREAQRRAARKRSADLLRGFRAQTFKDRRRKGGRKLGPREAAEGWE